jgi:hypothetical protein
MELAGLEPETSWVRFGRAPDSNHVDLQGFRPAPAGFGPPECPGIAGDYREFAPENPASGANVGAESGSPAAYRP